MQLDNFSSIVLSLVFSKKIVHLFFFLDFININLYNNFINLFFGGIFMSTETTKKVANPGPLGLLGFGMTTVLLNLHNADLLPLSIMIVAMGICLGGLAQIIAGVRELCQGNTFGGTAFTAYGLFWWSLVLIWTNPFAGTDEHLASHLLMAQHWASICSSGAFLLHLCLLALSNTTLQHVWYSVHLHFCSSCLHWATLRATTA